MREDEARNQKKNQNTNTNPPKQQKKVIAPFSLTIYGSIAFLKTYYYVLNVYLFIFICKKNTSSRSEMSCFEFAT